MLLCSMVALVCALRSTAHPHFNALRRTSTTRNTAGKVVIVDVGGVVFKLGWNTERWTPVPGAPSGVAALANELCMKVMFVTKAISENQKNRVKRELRELLPTVDYKLRFVANGKDKGQVCATAMAAWMVDDSARPLSSNSSCSLRERALEKCHVHLHALLHACPRKLVNLTSESFKSSPTQPICFARPLALNTFVLAQQFRECWRLMTLQVCVCAVEARDGRRSETGRRVALQQGILYVGGWAELLETLR